MTISEGDLYKVVGERIRIARKRVELTQEQLAKRVGLERPSITNIERGEQRMPLHVLFAIASAVNEDIRDLLPANPRVGDGANSVLVKISAGVEQAIPQGVAAALSRLNLTVR